MNATKNRNAWLPVLALLGLLSLSGCGTMRLTSFDTVLERRPTQQCLDVKLYKPDSGQDTAARHAELDLLGFLKHEKAEGHDAGRVLDDFLDCTVGYLGPQAPAELKAYRGYVALAVLSRYAAFNYTGQVAGDLNLDFKPYKDMHDDALATLARIDMSDRALRMASGLGSAVGNPGQDSSETVEALRVLDQSPYYLPTVSKMHRVLSVLLVATAAEKPTVARAKNWLERIVEAVSGAVFNTGDALQQGLTVLGKGLTMKTFGNAYLADVRRDLEGRAPRYAPPGQNAKATPAQSAKATCGTAGYTCPSADDWKYWARIIKNSCDRLATATGASSHCLTDWQGVSQ